MFSSFPPTLETFFPAFRSSTCSRFNKRFAFLHHDHFLSDVDPRVEKRMTTMQIMTPGCCKNELNGWHRVGLANDSDYNCFSSTLVLVRRKKDKAKSIVKRKKKKKRSKLTDRKERKNSGGAALQATRDLSSHQSKHTHSPASLFFKTNISARVAPAFFKSNGYITLPETQFLSEFLVMLYPWKLFQTGILVLLKSLEIFIAEALENYAVLYEPAKLDLLISSHGLFAGAWSSFRQSQRPTESETGWAWLPPGFLWAFNFVPESPCGSNNRSMEPLLSARA